MSTAPEILDPRAPGRAAHALRAWLAFQSAFALRPTEGMELLERAGDPARALAAAGSRRRRLEAADPARGRPTARASPGDPDAAIAVLRRVGARAVPVLSPAYPSRLRRLADPPLVLLVKGDPAVLTARSVAVVGSRAATAYGLEVARRLADGLARAGLVVVSGMARGVDRAAHEGALDAGGLTVAVQGCGPDRVYPAAHRGLAERIAARGAVVSELPPGAPPLRQHFPFRNRLISGLSEAVVVVEARERSGSLITARHALDQGLDVFAVPGPITAPTSRGPNALLADGAAPVVDVDQWLAALGLPAARPPDAGCPEAGAPPTGVRRIVEALRHEAGTRDELARRLDVAPESLAPDLLELELDGAVVEDRDGRLRVVS